MAYCSTHGDYHTICVPCALNQHNQDTIYGAGPYDSYYPPGAGVNFNWKATCIYDDKKVVVEGGPDMVNSPDHYTQGSIECIEAIEEVVKHLDGMEAMCTGNAIKYLWRWKHKNGTEDLKKAVWYIQRMIDEFDSH